MCGYWGSKYYAKILISVATPKPPHDISPFKVATYTTL